jgi:hypothetical protein
MLLFRPLRAMLRDPEAKILAIAALAMIAVGATVYVLVEHWTPLQAVYFCVVTLATVGYGDFHPTTELGQLFTILYIVVGVGIIAAFVTELAKQRHDDGLVARLEARMEERKPGPASGGGPASQ